MSSYVEVTRKLARWKFQLVDDLTALRYQHAIEDVRGVFQPAESRMLDQQPKLEDIMKHVCEQRGAKEAGKLITQYTNRCLEGVDQAYDELIDYLMFTQLYSYAEVAPPAPPTVSLPETSVVTPD